MIPERSYIAKAFGPANVSEVGEKQTPQVAVPLQIVGGTEDGSAINWRGFVTPKSVEFTMKALRALGFKGDDIMMVQGQTLPNPVNITVTHETYEGKTYARVKWVNPIGGFAGKPVSGATAAKLTALCKGVLNGIPEVDAPDVEGEHPAVDAVNETFGSHYGEASPADDIPF